MVEKIHPGLRGAFFYAAYWGAVGMYEPFISLYFLSQGLDGTQIGWMAAVLPLCTLLVTPLISRAADRSGRRVVLLAAACAGYGASLTLLALPGLNPTFPLLLAIVGLYAVFRSPIVSLADSLIAPMAVRRELNFGSMRLWGSIIFTITAIGLGALWQRTGYPTMFLLSGLAFIPVVAAALMLEEAPPPAQSETHTTGRKLTLDPGVLFLLGATFLIIAALFMAGTFGAIYMTQLGGTPMLVGGTMGIAALGEVPGMLYGSRVARRLGDTNALLLSYGLMAVGLAGYALTSTPWVLLVYSAVRGVGFGLVLVSTVMIINNRAPKDFTSTYQGLLSALCWGLAPLLGGPISGWIFQVHGPRPLFFFAGGMALLAGILILPTYRIWRSMPLRARVSES